MRTEEGKGRIGLIGLIGRIGVKEQEAGQRPAVGGYAGGVQGRITGGAIEPGLRGRF